MNDERPSWDDYFMNIAVAASQRATCSRRKVGAVFVSEDNMVLATGYNGAPSGEPHCDHFKIYHDFTGEFLRTTDTKNVNNKEHCAVVVHAELNAVLHAAKKGISLQGSKLYVTYRPCEECSKFLLQLQLKEIHVKTEKN